MNRVRRSLTYANVMSTVAVFAVLAGGSAWAASKIGSSDIKNGAVTAKKLHENAVATKKIKNDAVTGEKVKESSLGSVPTADTAAIGESPVIYASVRQDGTVDAAHSRGLADANVVTNPPGSDPGTYCIKGLTGVKSAMVVADTQGGNNHATIRIGEGAITPNYCGSVVGTQFAVSTFDLNAPADKGFYIWFFN